MVVGHIEYNAQTPLGGDLSSVLEALERGVTGLGEHVATLVQMKDGGSLTSYAVGKYGFGTTANAAAALAEMEAAKGALDGIAATLNQLFAKFRNG